MKATKTNKAPRGRVPAFPYDHELLRAVVDAAKTVNPEVRGLTHVTATHAVLQAPGDPAYYLVEVTPLQASDLGYIRPH